MEQPNGTFRHDDSMAQRTCEGLYWMAVDQVLSYAGNTYAQAYKLRENLENDQTKHRVWSVFETYYNLDWTRLDHEIWSRHAELEGYIRRANAWARGLGLLPVNDIDGMIEMLLDTDRRNFYKRLAKQYEKKGTAVSLQEFECKYQDALAQSPEPK